MMQIKSKMAVVLGTLFIVIGIAVFGIRLFHSGPYAMPHSGALYGAIALLAIGGFLVWSGKLRLFGWIAALAGLIASFPALYSIMGESEEVISLYAKSSTGEVTDLRLWVVDRDDGAWVGMPRAKAETHNLDGAQLQMLRLGKTSCTQLKLFEDRATVENIHAMKVAKYRVAQVSGAIGLYPLEASQSTVALRLDTCQSP